MSSIKKALVLSMVVLLSMALFGCGQDKTSKDNGSKLEDTPKHNSISDEKLKNSKVDIDFTVMSDTMVLAEINNMMAEPQNYRDKIIKIKGPYSLSEDPGLNMKYHFVVFTDTGGCCQRGIEFIWRGEHAFPEDYPSEGQPVEVTGIFGSYVERGQIYYYLDSYSVKF